MAFAKANCIPESLKDNIFRLTRELLTYTTYDKNSPERKYLTAKSPNPALYRAYFFRPGEVPVEEQSYALNELLKVITDSQYEFPTKFDQLITEHLSIEGCTIDEEVYRNLLKGKLNSYQSTKTALATIYNASHKTPIDIHEYIRATLKEIRESDSYIKNEKIKQLFCILIYAAPTRDWVQTFTDELIKFPHYENRADWLLAYLREWYKNPIPPLFEDAYYASKNELQEKRTDLVMVLRAIGEKKKQKSE